MFCVLTRSKAYPKAASIPQLMNRVCQYVCAADIRSPPLIPCQDRRPVIPHSMRGEIPPKLISLMEKCWSKDPKKRPNFRSALLELHLFSKPQVR